MVIWASRWASDPNRLRTMLELHRRGVKVVDLSADFRLRDAATHTVLAGPAHDVRVVAVAAVVGVVIIPQLGTALFPEFKERDFLMHWVTTPGTSQPEESRIVLAASRELRAIPGVRNFGSHIGRAEVADEVVGPNRPVQETDERPLNDLRGSQIDVLRVEKDHEDARAPERATEGSAGYDLFAHLTGRNVSYSDGTTVKDAPVQRDDKTGTAFYVLQPRVTARIPYRARAVAR